MNDQPPPLNLRDPRLILESFVAALAILPAGVISMGLPVKAEIGVLLGIAALAVFVNRLLGKSATDGIQTLTASINRLLARDTVLTADAKPSTVEAAQAAVVAVSVPPKDAGKVPETPAPGPV